MERKGYTKLYVADSDPAEAVRIGFLSTKGFKIYAFVCLLLFASNLCFLGLWLRATSTNCIRPQLTYCTLCPLKLNLVEGIELKTS